MIWMMALSNGVVLKKEVCVRHKKWVDARLSQGHKRRLDKTYITDHSYKEVSERSPRPTTPLALFQAQGFNNPHPNAQGFLHTQGYTDSHIQRPNGLDTKSLKTFASKHFIYKCTKIYLIYKDFLIQKYKNIHIRC